MTKVINPFERDLSEAYTAAEHCACVCNTGSSTAKSLGQAYNPISCACQCGSSSITSSANSNEAYKYRNS